MVVLLTQKLTSDTPKIIYDGVLDITKRENILEFKHFAQQVFIYYINYLGWCISFQCRSISIKLFWIR
jgi:hypothetical protein